MKKNELNDILLIASFDIGQRLTITKYGIQ